MKFTTNTTKKLCDPYTRSKYGLSTWRNRYCRKHSETWSLKTRKQQLDLFSVFSFLKESSYDKKTSNTELIASFGELMCWILIQKLQKTRSKRFGWTKLCSRNPLLLILEFAIANQHFGSQKLMGFFRSSNSSRWHPMAMHDSSSVPCPNTFFTRITPFSINFKEKLIEFIAVVEASPFYQPFND